MRFYSLVLSLILIVLLYFAARWFTRTPAAVVSQRLKQLTLYGLGFLLIILAMSGRLPWLFALIGGLLPALGRLWMLRRLLQTWRTAFGGQPKQTQQPKPGGQTSTISTQFLRMVLDHDTGDLDGEIIQGQYNNHKLSQLNVKQLCELLERYRGEDQDSTQVLEAYLDRRFGDAWHEQEINENQHRSTAPSEMTIAEAYSILGLEKDPNTEQIKQAHRRLMQKLHPDRGGSDYLAAKVNQAKELLLKASH